MVLFGVLYQFVVEKIVDKFPFLQGLFELPIWMLSIFFAFIGSSIMILWWMAKIVFEF